VKINRGTLQGIKALKDFSSLSSAPRSWTKKREE